MRLRTKVRDHIHLLAGLNASAGLSAAVRWEFLRVVSKLGFPEPAAWSVRPRRALHPVRARLHGSSDMQVFHQIFVFEEYSSLRELKKPALVLDLGANVGYSSAYFLSIFPNARVVAVEPDERNLAVCKANLSPYGDRVLLLHGAVWSKPGGLRLVRGAFGDGREWASQVEESASEDTASPAVQAWDIGTLIEMSGSSTVDLLKVDIERAELSVFGKSASSWLGRVRNICIELHGKDCEDVFFAALQDFAYELEHSGELTICRNLRQRAGASNSLAVSA